MHELPFTLVYLFAGYEKKGRRKSTRTGWRTEMHDMNTKKKKEQGENR